MNSKTKQAIRDSIDFFRNVAAREKLQFAYKHCDDDSEKRMIKFLQESLENLAVFANNFIKDKDEKDD